MDAAESTQLMTTIEAANAMRISKRALQNLKADHKIGFIKMGSTIRFHRDDIARFIESHRCQPVGWKSGTNKGGSK